MLEYIAPAARTSKIIRNANEKLGLHGRRAELHWISRRKYGVNLFLTGGAYLAEFQYAFQVAVLALLVLGGEDEYIASQTTLRPATCRYAPVIDSLSR
jgi:hypothetical protein